MKTRILLVMACIGILSPVMHAAPPLAERVPGGALVYMGWAGTRNAAFRKTTIAGFLTEPVFGRVLDMVKTAISNEVYDKEARKVTQAVWPMVEIAGRSPMAVVWTGFEKADRGPYPRVALIVDLGAEKKAFNGHLEALMKLIPPESRKKLKELTTEVKGRDVKYSTVQEKNSPDVSFGYMGDMFFVTIGSGMAAELVKVTPAESLQADKAFVARVKEVSGQKYEQLAFHVDIPAVRKAVISVLPPADDRRKGRPSVDEMLRLLGIAKVQAVAGATTAVGKELISRTKIFSPSPHKGAMMVFGGKALTDADLAHVPADADIVLAFNISASRAWKELRKIVRGFDPKAEEEMRGGFGQLGTMFGVSLEDDILANLGDTWVVSGAVSQGGSPTGTVLTVELKDPAAFARTIAKIEMAVRVKNMFGGGGGDDDEERRPRASIEKLKVGDTEVHYILSSRGFMPITPAWAVHNKKLYLAMYPQVIKSAIDNEGKNPITASPGFAALRARSNKNALGLLYVNTPQLLGRHYAMALLLAHLGAQYGGGRNGQPIRPDFLPAMSTIVKYVPATMMTVSADKTGVTVEQHGAHPLSSLVDAFFTAGPIVIPTVAVPLND